MQPLVVSEPVSFYILIFSMVKKNKHYLLLFAVAYFIVSSAVILLKRPDLFPWIGECHPGGYKEGYFMAYCNSYKYGNYEHRAYWDEISPVSMAPVKKADVLFLGNSRTQYAFSTQSVMDYFTRTNISHYVFGFGVGSLAVVPEKMSEKFQLTPKVLVINADPFFLDDVSQTDQKMLATDFKATWEFTVKHWMQNLQSRICDSENREGWLNHLMCSGTKETVYRDPEHGYWKTDFYRSNQKIPVTYTDNMMRLLNDATTYAQGFIQRMGVKKSCIIVTVTPRSNTPIMFAQKLAYQLDVVSILPMVKGLTTLDQSHLDHDSARRWSKAFLEKAAPHIEACTAA